MRFDHRDSQPQDVQDDPCRVVDVDTGEQIPLCQAADEETGEYEHLDIDPGPPLHLRLTAGPQGCRIRRLRGRCRLRIEPLYEGEEYLHEPVRWVGKADEVEA